MSRRLSWFGLPWEVEEWLYHNIGPGGRHLDLGHDESREEWWDGDCWKLVSRPSGHIDLVFLRLEDEVMFGMMWERW